jgi:TetR/AcrR family transcriptional regulator, regulator of autoinduction and epiphytic fitness
MTQLSVPADPRSIGGGEPLRESDGRRLRRKQNRDAVLDALLALFRDGIYQPSTAEIAQRAGISPRSLFRYFTDVDDLHRAALNRQLQRALPLTDIDTGPDAPTAEKIVGVVQSRARLWEEVAPAARALRAAAHRHQQLARELRRNRSFMRDQLRAVFQPELARFGEGGLPAIEVMTSFEAYELLRYDQRMPRARAEAVMVASISALLTAPGGNDEGPAHP